MKTIIRLISGRIAYERRARLIAVEMAPHYAAEVGSHEYAAQRIAHFLLTGEFPR